MTDLEGVAVVTGAARGMGAAIARRLAAAGAHVVLGDVDADGLQATVDALVADGFDATGVPTDVSVEEDVVELAARAAAAGRLTAWVNNAGAIHRAPLLEIEVGDWDRMLAVNARGCFLGVREAGRRMREHGGAITNLASISSVVALPDTAHYGAAKGAVASLTRHAALELGPHGIRVNAVAPGTIRTSMTADRLDQAGQLERTLQRIPAGRIGEPSDVAGVVAFLCSADAAFVNGSLVTVDGGWTSA